MPLIQLPPGKSIDLGQGDCDEIQNNTDRKGAFTIAFKTHPLVLQEALKAKHHVAIDVPQGGVTVRNDGHAELTVGTPGL
jgi:hypothetical protein